MRTQYTIKKQASGKYVVFFGSLPFSREMTKQDAQQWLDMQNGLVSEMATGWRGTNSGNMERNKQFGQ